MLVLSACLRTDTVPELVFYVDWNLSNIEHHQKSWEVVNDKNIHIHITEGRLINHTFQLLPCPALYPFNILNTAFAGHGFPAQSTDTSAVFYSYSESLSSLQFREVHRQNLEPRSYCSAHNLIAKYRSEQKTMMEGLSMWIQGRWRDHSNQWVDFDLKTGLANGTSQSVSIETSKSVDIVFLRDPSTLFNGIDFSTAKPKFIERQILNNLMQDSKIEVRQ
ncbi:MAG: hypothetical protein CMK59_04440 [Proteobacteria bacterium]|nr:hypothetical protein [Pseudomonadota bacterium]